MELPEAGLPPTDAVVLPLLLSPTVSVVVPVLDCVKVVPVTATAMTDELEVALRPIAARCESALMAEASAAAIELVVSVERVV